MIVKSLVMAVILSGTVANASNSPRLSLSCERGTDQYQSVHFFHPDADWAVNNPDEGMARVEFAGFRKGATLIGTYLKVSSSSYKFVLTEAGTSASTVEGRVLAADSAHPVLVIEKGPAFLSEKNRPVPCVLK